MCIYPQKKIEIWEHQAIYSIHTTIRTLQTRSCWISIWHSLMQTANNFGSIVVTQSNTYTQWFVPPPNRIVIQSSTLLSSVFSAPRIVLSSKLHVKYASTKVFSYAQKLLTKIWKLILRCASHKLAETAKISHLQNFRYIYILQHQFHLHPRHHIRRRIPAVKEEPFGLRM